MQKIFTVVFSANAKCVLIEIWTTSSSILSRGVSLRAQISVISFYLYSISYILHAMRVFGNFILPLLLECRAEINNILSPYVFDHLISILLNFSIFPD